MNIKQLKSQSLLQEALQEALCELGDTRLRNLTITKVELSAGKESAKVFLDENSLDGAESARILSALKKASGIIRANISAQLSWYKVPNLRFEVDKDLAQMNRLESIFKTIHESRALNSSLGTPCGDLADFGHCADFSLALRPKSAKNSTTSTANTRICDLDSANQAQNAESTLDSAESQNLGENISSLRDSAKQNRGNPPIEKNIDSQGGLPRSPALARNDDYFLDSADSQNLVKKNCAKHPKSRPLRGAKNRNQASSSASADFLLEAEKRGTLPKSEKAELFGAQGERGEGCSPFCEKESKLSGKNSVRVAESSVDSADSATRAKIAESTTNFNKENPK